MFHPPALLAGITGLCLLAGPHPEHAAAADTVWQWQDPRGQTHFSDQPPPASSPPARQTRFESRAPGSAGGLRPGEQQALRRMDRQRARQREQAVSVRRRNDRAVSAQQSACRAARDKLHDAREHEQRKRYSGYLRRNCW